MLLIAYHSDGNRPRGLSVPLTATGKAAPSTIYIYTTQPPQTCYEPFVVALNLMPNLVAVPAAVLLLESASKMSEFAHGQPQHPNYTSCIYASCVFGDFRPSHLTKAEKSATTQLRDRWLVFPASIFSRIAGQGNASRPGGVSVSLSLAWVSVADIATEVRRASVGYRSRPRAAQGMCSANLS